MINLPTTMGSLRGQFSKQKKRRLATWLSEAKPGQPS